MGFSMQEYWSRLPLSHLGSLPNPVIEPKSSVLQADFFISHQGICPSFPNISSICGFVLIMPLNSGKKSPMPRAVRRDAITIHNGYILFCVWSNHDRSKTSMICTLEEQKLSAVSRMSVRREMHGAQRKGANKKRRETRRKLWERWIFRGQAEKEEPTKIRFLPILSEKEKLVSSFSHEDIGYLTCLWRNLYEGQEALISVTSDMYMTPP